MLEVCLDFIEQMNRIEPDFEHYIQTRISEEIDE
jgi:hypothetical protein